MKTFSATDAAISGFGLVREHPKAVGAWVLISTIVSAVVAVITVGLFGPQLEAFADLSQTNAQPDPAETLRMMGGLLPAMLCSMVYSVAFYSVLMAAIYRATLRPADSGQAYLRFGADELRQAGVSILMVLLFFAAYIGIVLVLALSIGILAAVSKPVGGLAALVLLPVGLGALIYFAVRLSLANVLTFSKGKIDIFGSMALTKGRFWPMFGAYVVATILAVVVYLLLFLIVTLLGGALSGFNMDNLGVLMQSQTTSLESLMTPTGILSLAVGGLIAVLTSVTIYTPSAFIYREIALGAETASDTFA
ncbi:hypothetical protein CFHF_06965 [Caulobacter flavus]|jgi:hypothetical protein|uniref:Glycerophosphoryl diester phosphodiesterase membrane domain-containing protein n=1 Tax=Caulobacter flavus TaxID=1679497 RepID=A0A2N5CW69_9CAUL|nr:hypothetical protein [Caulobacter flavus]AYV44933.1 hypothetical protein C1707_00920 [Caulobacter flavus]PLR18062.1 hypothetical protein CFHF_06965 [Caulobacter flavus]